MPKWKRYIAAFAVASPLAVTTDLTSLVLNGTWIT